MEPSKALIGVIALVVLVFVIQLLVGVFGTATSAVNKTLANTNFGQSQVSSGSSNAIWDNGVNTLTLTLSGSYKWITGVSPLTITVTGNTVGTFATNTALAVPSIANTVTYVTSSNATTQTLATATKFYNITSVSVSGVQAQAYPSMTATVAQNYWNANSLSANSVSGSAVVTVTQGQQTQQFLQTGQAQSTIIPFINIIVLVALVVILLALFGLKRILDIGTNEVG